MKRESLAFSIARISESIEMSRHMFPHRGKLTSNCSRTEPPSEIEVARTTRMQTALEEICQTVVWLSWERTPRHHVGVNMRVTRAQGTITRSDTRTYFMCGWRAAPRGNVTEEIKANCLNRVNIRCELEPKNQSKHSYSIQVSWKKNRNVGEFDLDLNLLKINCSFLICLTRWDMLWCLSNSFLWLNLPPLYLLLRNTFEPKIISKLVSLLKFVLRLQSR